jgi:hypothetical protein
MASFGLDIGASAGTPTNLPTSGQFIDLGASGGAPDAPHAQVGPSAPTGWYAVLSRDAQVTWAIPGGASSTADSVPPGDTISGFILRSTYLPGLTTVEAFPTIESCCQEPLDTADGVFQYALPGGFRATGVSTAPRYIPSEVTLDLLQSQLSAVCDDPLWIDDSSLCSQLADSLDATESRLASSDNVGAGTALDGVLSILDAEREPSGPIEDNAYWLVSLNAAHVLSTIPGGAVTLFATGDTDLRQGTPNQNQGDEDELSIRASGRHRALIVLHRDCGVRSIRPRIRRRIPFCGDNRARGHLGRRRSARCGVRDQFPPGRLHPRNTDRALLRLAARPVHG